MITKDLAPLKCLHIVNGFTIFTADDGFQTFTAKGRTIGIAPDIVLRLNGEFEKNGRYGKEFVFDQWEEVLPTELHKMILFLGSKVIKGIGPSLAQSIVSKFKEKTYDILDSHSEELLTVPKIGKKKAEKIFEETGLQIIFEKDLDKIRRKNIIVIDANDKIKINNRRII